MWALFAQDICFGWIMDKSLDPAFAAMTIIVFTILALEMLVHIFLTKSYFGSYFMVIDLVGTFLLIPEVFIYQASDDHYSSDETADSVLGVARAGRVARTAAMVRVGRIAKIIRVVRTMRVMQCLIMFNSWREARKKAKEKKVKAKKRREREMTRRLENLERAKAGKTPQEKDNYDGADDDDDDDDADDDDALKPSTFGLKVSERKILLSDCPHGLTQFPPTPPQPIL
jgi:hypothetical protein